MFKKDNDEHQAHLVIFIMGSRKSMTLKPFESKSEGERDDNLCSNAYTSCLHKSVREWIKGNLRVTVQQYFSIKRKHPGPLSLPDNLPRLVCNSNTISAWDWSQWVSLSFNNDRKEKHSFLKYFIYVSSSLFCRENVLTFPLHTSFQSLYQLWSVLLQHCWEFYSAITYARFASHIFSDEKLVQNLSAAFKQLCDCFFLTLAEG